MPIVMDLGFVELGELMISLAKQTEQGETMLPRFGPHRGNLLLPICSLIMREITKLIEMSPRDWRLVYCVLFHRRLLPALIKEAGSQSPSRFRWCT